MIPLIFLRTSRVKLSNLQGGATGSDHPKGASQRILNERELARADARRTASVRELERLSLTSPRCEDFDRTWVERWM